MKREIKFRAWAVEEGRFVQDFILDRIGNYYQTDKSEFWGYEDSLVIQQFTGLKDKNGKEIYDGDIVILPNETPWAVMWVQTGWNLNALYLNKFEIIGNIYESPEILTK